MLVETMTRKYKDPVDAIRSAYCALNAVERQKEMAIIRDENIAAAAEGRTPASIYLDTDERLRTMHQTETAAAVAALVARPASRDKVSITNEGKTFAVKLNEDPTLPDQIRTLEDHERTMDFANLMPWTKAY